MSASAGIHHVTAICGYPKRNVDFYTHNLGLSRPGTALTFFAWPGLPPGQNGNGMTLETAFIIPERSLGYWTQRLVERGIAHAAPQKRFGETVLPLSDPDGMRLALVAAKGADAVAGWSNGDVPAEHALRGFHGVALMVGAGAPTAEVLTAALGFKAAARAGNLQRFIAGDMGMMIQGGWAQGVLINAGFKLDDFIIAPGPSDNTRPVFLLNADAFIFWQRKEPDLQAGQTLMAQLVMDPAIQTMYSQIRQKQHNRSPTMTPNRRPS